MNEIIKKICDEIINQYRPDKNVLGIALFGSAARGNLDQYSDIDIYIILKEKASYSRSSFISNGIMVDAIFDTIDEVSLYLDEEYENIKRNTSHMLAHAKILYQIDNKFEPIIEKAKQNMESRTKYSNDEILMHKYSIDDFWGDVQRNYRDRDAMAFEINSNLLINNIIELFLKINGCFLPQPNEMTKFINEKDKFLGDYLAEYYNKNQKDKMENIPKIIDYIYSITGGLLPSTWQIK